jgi:hypothetical protein
MLRIYSIAILATISQMACAEWIKHGANEWEIVYYDSAISNPDNGKVRLWILFDFKKPKLGVVNGKTPLSSKVNDEFDCRREMMRMLFYSLHAKNMGKGDVIHIDTRPTEWAPIPPDTIVRDMYYLSCKTK